MKVRQPADGPLFADQGPRLPRVIRRTRGIVIEIIAFIVVTLLFPVLLIIAAIVDLLLWLTRRKPWTGIRLVAMLWWFLFGEMQALAGILGIWVLTGGPAGQGSLRRRRWLYGLRIHWAGSHLGGVRVLFGLHFELEGLEEVARGPFVMMMRHASIVDNLLPDAIVGHAHGLGMRFVIKRELQVLPTIDIAGRWVPTLYVRRASEDPESEIAAMRTLVHGLGEGEGVLIYPEGTRPTPKKIARAQEIIAERQPEIAPLAAGLKHLLPPRLGGPLALLDEAAGTDVVICGHTGFDGLVGIGDIWNGKLVGRTIRIRFWRFPGDQIPLDEKSRIIWLYERWQILDDWVGG